MFIIIIIIIILENVAIIAMYCHLRLPYAIAFPTEHLLGFQILAADEPNTVSSRGAVGRHVNAVGVRWTVTKQ